MADAAQRARLQVGQFLHSVNGISMDGVTREQARATSLEARAPPRGAYAR